MANRDSDFILSLPPQLRLRSDRRISPTFPVVSHRTNFHFYLVSVSSHHSEQSIPVWPTALRFRRCPSLKVAGLTPRHSRPAAPSLSGRSFSRFEDYRKEQNLHPMMSEPTFADLDLSFSARSIHIVTIGGNFHSIYCFSLVLSEEHVSPVENFQQHITNNSSTSCLHDPPTQFGCIVFKSHQCSLTLTLVPSRLRPEEHVYFLEKLCKNSPMALSGSGFQEISKTHIWAYYISVLKSFLSDLSETHTGLKSDSPSSSFKERSFPLPSSNLERTFLPSTLFSCMVEPFKPQSHILLYAIDKLLAGPETLFASTSIKFEFIVRIVSSTAVLLFCSNTTHIVLNENLQVCRELKMRFISICFMYFLNLSWIECNS